jgi:hypothetical protein
MWLIGMKNVNLAKIQDIDNEMFNLVNGRKK